MKELCNYQTAIKNDFSISNAFALLRTVWQEGTWATGVSFVYSVKEQAVYYAENNRFEHIMRFVFPLAEQKRNSHVT